jgi:DNA-binding transcriptional ArsR family regulator
VDEPLSAEVLHALAHPIRLAALLALEQRERTSAELAATLAITEPELMSHLHLLDAAGLIATTSETRRLRVRSSGWTDVARRLQQLQDDSAGEY